MLSSLIFLLSKVMGNNGEWIQILKLVITQLSYQITSKLMVNSNSYSSVMIMHETFPHGPNKISEDPFFR